MSLQVDESSPEHTDEAPSSGRAARRLSFGFLVGFFVFFFLEEAGQTLDRRRTDAGQAWDRRRTGVGQSRKQAGGGDR